MKMHIAIGLTGGIGILSLGALLWIHVSEPLPEPPPALRPSGKHNAGERNTSDTTPRSNHAQDATETGVSTNQPPMNGEQLAKLQTPKVSIRPVEIPGHLEALMDATENNYLVRRKALRSLDRSLNDDEIQVLYALLNRKNHEDRLPAANLNGLKDSIANLIEAQDHLHDKYAHNLMAMYYDAQHDEVWRDYCVQHLGKVLRRMESVAEKKDVNALFWQATETKDGTIAGTALISLTHNVDDPTVNATAIAKKALDICNSPATSIPAKITALQICSTLGERDVLPVARQILAANEPTLLRMSAIAAIGTIGSETDRPLLQQFAQSSDIRLQNAATSALDRLNKSNM